jgi:sorbitol/mannitol transport system permease protein
MSTPLITVRPDPAPVPSPVRRELVEGSLNALRQAPGERVPRMRVRSRISYALAARTLAAWAVTLLLFFPLGWLILTAFKTELQAISVPPLFFFTPTLENFAEVQSRSDYLLYAKNSIITSVVSTLLGLAIAGPAAYSMTFFRTKRTRDILMWMLSTKMMPAVGALVPVYVLAQKSSLLDTQAGLIIVFTLSNLPIMVWMLYSHFKDIPGEILEAARMDGATLWQECRMVLLPLAMGGFASTGLLCLVLAWNEAFWALNLSAAKAGTLATLIASYSSPEGLFWSKLSAASLMAIAPIVVFGWFTQKQLVQGLTFGAVK